MMKKKLNAVCAKLAKGNGSVKGMKMLLPVERTCLVEVIVEGIDFDTFAYKGVSVKVSPVHGAGYSSVSAPTLVDDTEEARGLYFRKSEAEQFIKNNKPGSQSDRQWASCLVSLRAGLTDAQIKEFDERAFKIIKDKALKSCSTWELEKLLPILAVVKFNLDDAVDGDD